MAQLVFYDATHEYRLGDVVLPSVSEVLRFMSREVYGDISQYKLDNAADRGTSAHKATELLDLYGTAEVDDPILPYVQAYIQFRKDHKCVWTGIEKPVYHAELGFAGTIDRDGTVDDVPAIVDIKCQGSIKKPLVKAQLNGYKIARNAPPETKLYCLQLYVDDKGNGKYRLYPVATDTTEFLACLSLHKSLEAKHPRGEIS